MKKLQLGIQNFRKIIKTIGRKTMFKKSHQILLSCISLLMALVVLTGCSLTNPTLQPSPGGIESPPNDTAQVSNESPSDPTTSAENTDPVTPSTPAENTDPVTTNSPAENTDPAATGSPADNTKSGYQKGTVTDTSFSSEYLNLRFEVPQGYIMAANEDLDALLQFGSDIVFADTDQKIIDYAMANIVYEMMASSQNGLPNVQVFVEKLRLRNMTVDQYMDALKQQLSGLDGFNYSFEDVKTTQFVGESYSMLSSVMQSGGMEIKQEYRFRKEDDRIICIIVTFNEETIAEKDELLNIFSSY